LLHHPERIRRLEPLCPDPFFPAIFNRRALGSLGVRPLAPFSVFSCHFSPLFTAKTLCTAFPWSLACPFSGPILSTLFFFTDHRPTSPPPRCLWAFPFLFGRLGLLTRLRSKMGPSNATFYLLPLRRQQAGATPPEPRVTAFQHPPE